MKTQNFYPGIFEPTYKKTTGFQPVQMVRDGRVVNATFRGGDELSNHSDTEEKMIINLYRRIQRLIRDDLAIMIPMDSDLVDQALFNLSE